jgi:N-acetylmuramate 1-kinase
MTIAWSRKLNEAGVVRLAGLLALKIETGDALALQGDIGAGKTTFARALIRALLGDNRAEVPSPTFSLQQIYETPRITVSHFDLFRLSSAEEALELGLDDCLRNGAAVIEWPERARALLPADRFELALAESEWTDTRCVTLTGFGTAADRVRRIGELFIFLERQGRWNLARIERLEGDASTRDYSRLVNHGGTAIVMDAPRRADGPPIRDGKSYSRIAHLAEDVRPFVAIDQVLRVAGLSVPEIFAHDLDHGLLVIEDFGNRGFSAQLCAGTSQAVLWRAAVDVLVELRRVPVPASLPLPDGEAYALPRFDRAALEIEVELLLDWLWPGLFGEPAPSEVRDTYMALWSPVIDRLLALPQGWFLRDFHSPNLFWLPQRRGVARVGVIDFQDALAENFAFDLVSLLQDARIDVPSSLETELFDHYCAHVTAAEPDFDRAAFAAAYADFGAQRNARLLGLWARLLLRDGKPQYLRHLPRTWDYLARNLRQSALAPIAAWFERHFPPEIRYKMLFG